MSTPHMVKSPLAVSAVSGHLDTRTAATEIADTLFDEFEGAAPAELIFVFGSFHHRSAFDDAAEIIRKTLSPRNFVGVTAEAVLGNDRELDGIAGMSAIALRFPGNIKIHPWLGTPDEPLPLQDQSALRERLGIPEPPNNEPLTTINEPITHTLFLFGDPFSTPVTKIMPAINALNNAQQRIVVTGGMASGASQPGLNVLVLNDRIVHAGVIGVTVSGDVGMEFLVSQGCRPIGKPMVVTKCHQNVVLELGGRKAMTVLQEMAAELSDAEKQLLKRGLLMGSVVNEYKSHFGRGDFLIRNIIGFDQKTGGIAVGEMCRVGQTMQFHVRDAATAAEDLQLLLDVQVMHEPPPFAMLLFSCNGRGERLFGQPNHDISIIRQRLGEIPIAGFFAAGEYGPIGQKSFLHAHTASVAIMRGRH